MFGEFMWMYKSCVNIAFAENVQDEVERKERKVFT